MISPPPFVTVTFPFDSVTDWTYCVGSHVFAFSSLCFAAFALLDAFVSLIFVFYALVADSEAEEDAAVALLALALALCLESFALFAELVAEDALAEALD